MADDTEAHRGDDPPKPGEQEGDSDGGLDGDPEEGLTDAQTELLEKCLHSLKHAKNDSHTLAALLLVRLGHQDYTFSGYILKDFSAKTNVKRRDMGVCCLVYVYTLNTLK